MARGFPSQNPHKQKGIQHPAAQGGLMEWLSWNFPTVFAKVKNNPRDGTYDYKDAAFRRKFPTRSGRVP